MITTLDKYKLKCIPMGPDNRQMTVQPNHNNITCMCGVGSRFAIL